MIRTPSKVMMVSSSPGRPEKLPAPVLTTLLRGKSGSRSRGRSSSYVSRSSPMFPARRRSASATVDLQEEKEPSSPKVTCIGQVRIRKRNSSSCARSQQQQKEKQMGCLPWGCPCFKSGFLCNPFSKRLGAMFKQASVSPYRHRDARGWRKWFFFPRSRCYRRRKPPRQRPQHEHWLKEEPPRVPAAAAETDDEGESTEQGEADDEEEEVETKVFVPATPPKNALLLMRCRSAPHRPACVPDRLWASSPCGGEPRNPVGTLATAPGEAKPSYGGNRGDGPLNDYSVSSYEARARTRHCAAAEETREEAEVDDGEAAAVGPTPSFSSRPLILTRCKSEPARRAAKLAAPDASYCFWNSGSNQSNKPRIKNSNSSAIINSNKRWLTLLGEARPIPSQL